MKHGATALLLAAALASGQAKAGGMAAPVMEPAVIEEESAATSRAGIIVPILALVLIGLAISRDDPQPVEGPSDARLKTDILRVGTAANGLPLYQFRYLGQRTLYQGVMAQDVLAHSPQAVSMLPGGYMAVNYKMLGLEMKVID